MAKLGREDRDRIIKRDLPGYRVVEQRQSEADESADTTTAPVRPEAGTPDVAELRRKYFGSSDSAADSVSTGHNPGSNPGSNPGGFEEDEDEIVRVTPESVADPLDRGGRAKSVIISREGVKGSQG
jgi:hypothetical protein